MAHVHFINTATSNLANVAFNNYGSQLSLDHAMTIHDPMIDIATFASNWSITFMQTNLSTLSLWSFVNMTHFLDFLRSLEGDIFLQKSNYPSDYNISFTIADDYTKFTNELSDRARLRISFTKDDVWTAARNWLETEYANERDFCARNRYITCRDAELASMVRLRSSPECD